MINICIDGKNISVKEGTTIIDAARANDIEIPSLCYLERANKIGSCRLCVVEVEGTDKLTASCNTVVREGMVIHTKSDRIRKHRQTILDLLLSNHHKECFSCSKNGNCKLQQYCFEYEIEESSFMGDRYKIERPERNAHPFLRYKPSLCIHCLRCISACVKASGRHAIGLHKVGMYTVIDAPFDENWYKTNCESCGNCAEACPTGALIERRINKYDTWEVHPVRTTCPRCSVGCQFDLLVKDDVIYDIKAAQGPSNRSRLCDLGRSKGFDFVQDAGRLKTPMIKNKETGEFEPVSWEEAMNCIVDKFTRIKAEHGGNALDGFASPKLCNEDIYMFRKMANTCFGVKAVDRSLGHNNPKLFDGGYEALYQTMTNPIVDCTRGVDCIMLVGSDPEITYPVIGMHIRRAVEIEARLINLVSKDIQLTPNADIQLLVKNDSYKAIARAMTNYVIGMGLADKKYTEQYPDEFETIRKMVQYYTPEKTAADFGLDADKLKEAALMYATAKKAPIIYCHGETEKTEDLDDVKAMFDLAKVCGKMGRSGCGVSPLRGYNSVRSTKVIPDIESGETKSLYIYGDDPAANTEYGERIKAALSKLDFLVVHDTHLTATARMADVVLPGMSYAEKEGTVTNAARRVQRIRKAINMNRKPGFDLRPGTDVIIELMNRMGVEQKYMTPADIMDEIAEVMPMQFGGISHARLDSEEIAGQGIQWPCPSKDHPGTIILFEDLYN